MGEVQHSINYYLYLVLCTSKIKDSHPRTAVVRGRLYGEVIRIGWDQDKTTLILRTLLIPSPGAPSESERVLDSTWIPSIRQGGVGTRKSYIGSQLFIQRLGDPPPPPLLLNKVCFVHIWYVLIT